MATAKVFMTGRSQAVRLPKEFRFDAREVAIRREGETVILEPIKASRWPRGLWEAIRIRDTRFERPRQAAMPPSRALDG